MFSRESKLEILSRIRGEGVKDGDLSLSDSNSNKQKKVKNNTSKPKSKKKVRKKKNDQRKKKNKKVEDENLSARGDGHAFRSRGKGYGLAEDEEQVSEEVTEKEQKLIKKARDLYINPDWSEVSHMEPSLGYGKEYLDKRDITLDHLEAIKNHAEEILEGELPEGVWDEKFTLDQDAQERTGFEHALNEAIWSYDDGKFQSKIEPDDYNYLIQDYLDKKSSLSTQTEKNIHKGVQQLLEEEAVMDNGNSAWMALQKPKYSYLSGYEKDKIHQIFLHRLQHVKGELEEFFPIFPENVQSKKSSLKAYTASINSLKWELANLKRNLGSLKTASKKEFNPHKAFKKLFDNNKKLTRLDISYNFQKYHGLEDEEVDTVINDALKEGVVSQVDKDLYSYAGNLGKQYHNKVKKEQKHQERIESTQKEIENLQQTIKEKEQVLNTLINKHDQLKKEVELEKLKKINVPEYTKRVFEDSVHHYIDSLCGDDKERSYKLKYSERNPYYKPVFQLDLYSGDPMPKKKASELFQKRLKRLINSNFGYCDYELEGDGIVNKDDESGKCDTKVYLIMDQNLTLPEHIDTIKKEIELLVHFMDDHFVL